MNKKISSPIAIIIILVCAVLAGIIAWQYRFIPEIEISSFTPSKKPPKDETVGWKTYRNEDYGFEIKYPGDVDFDSIDYTDPADLIRHNINPEYSAGNLLLIADFDFTDTSTHSYSLTCASYEVEITKIDYSDINNWIEDRRKRIETPTEYEGMTISGKLSLIKDIEIQGKAAKRITIEGGFPYLTVQFGVINNGKLYTLNYLDMSSYDRQCFKEGVEVGENKYKDIFDNLISTFRFLE
ncbi:MAG: hypothetical protein COU42_02905 [Candidatus Nealsonbacteria bacterium CG10_big_fil_rev_8_21_14_0_10_36_24]|uniref:Uncharacterized protein n=2 Tax=Candidatus Nealsoniibacteriota TaxID=1817911 RepID=A0A2H0YN91_9BACT|nr:MAG: hypothetical protein COU42_02905 [Candidatus Nealsonbacteria bacterium CG10_big_fil_rev_8_21_14_0_10_36_24]PIS39974.1 MAG: hypothetical protein COT32_02245 [Candidatus Nealsonbacteria bacterium CG08_land_8_20_14_0_20_36_22]